MLYIDAIEKNSVPPLLMDLDLSTDAQPKITMVRNLQTYTSVARCKIEYCIFYRNEVQVTQNITM